MINKPNLKIIKDNEKDDTHHPTITIEVVVNGFIVRCETEDFIATRIFTKKEEALNWVALKMGRDNV